MNPPNTMTTLEPHPFDLLTVAELRDQRGVKWNKHPDDVIGAFVAEMDFGTAPEIVAVLHDAVDRSRFGYLSARLEHELADGCAAWLQRSFGWSVSSKSIHGVPDVIRGMEIAVNHFSRPGSKVILPTPAYMPFFDVPGELGRELITVPSPRDALGRYHLDLDGIDTAFGSGGGIVVLCNPWNPVGTVFTEAELVALSEVVAAHGGRVFADEIHAPLVYRPHRHIPYASVSEIAAGHTITSLSASKAWNLPGLKCAEVILTNDEDRRVWRNEVGLLAKHGTATVGVIAHLAAFESGAAWLAGVVDYLDGNRHLLGELVADRLGPVDYRPPDGTYLAWLDYRVSGLGDAPAAHALEHARVALTEGADCGAPGFVRLNLATPRPVLIEIVDRLARSLTRR